jgi:Leucine-rich repeat (LRR) protein
MNPAEAPVRRRYTLSLKLLMLLVLVIGGGLGWTANRLQSRRRAVQAVRKVNGTIFFDYQFSSAELDANRKPPLPAWLVRLLGEEFFFDVTRVYRLDLSHADPTAARAALEAIHGFDHLEALRLVNPPPGTRLSGLSELSQLEISLTGPGGGEPIRLGRLPKLREVRLDGAGIDDSLLPDLASIPSVREILLENTSVTDAGLARLDGPADLEVLWLSGARVTDAGLRSIARLRKLEILDLNRNVGVTNDGLRVLSENQTGLTHLMVGDTSVTDEGLVHLTKFRRLVGFQIGGQGAKLTDAGLARIAEVPQLEVLNVRGSSITDAGLEKLAKLEKLRWLQASTTAITDDGLRHLGKIKSLQYLDLRITRITDAGLIHLAALPALEHLSLDSTPLTDEGLQHLHGLKSLKVLSIRGTNVTAEGVAELKATLPASTVVRAGSLAGPRSTVAAPRR